MLEIPLKTGLYSQLPNEITYFFDAEITDLIVLPHGNPCIDKVESLNIAVDILSTKLIKTIVANSYEGHLLSGYKLNVECKIQEKIIYESKYYNKVMQIPYFKTMTRNLYIVLPEIYNGQKIEKLIRRKKFLIKSHVVDTHTILRSQNSIFRYINLIVYLEFID